MSAAENVLFNSSISAAADASAAAPARTHHHAQAHGHHHCHHEVNNTARNLEIAVRLVEMALLIINVLGAFGVGPFGGPKGSFILGVTNSVGIVVITGGKLLAEKIHVNHIHLGDRKSALLLSMLALGILGITGVLSSFQLAVGSMAAYLVINQAGNICQTIHHHSHHHGHHHNHHELENNHEVLPLDDSKS